MLGRDRVVGIAVGMVLLLIGAPCGAAEQLGAVAGCVTERGTDRALQGVRVWPPGTSYCAFTDSAGRFVLDSLPVGEYRLRTACGRYSVEWADDVTVDGGCTTHVDFALTPPPSPDELERRREEQERRRFVARMYDAWKGRVDSLVGAHRYDDALTACDSLMVYGGDRMDVWLTRGDVLERMGLLQDALEHYGRAIVRFRTEPEVWRQKAAVLARMGQDEKLDELHNDAIESFGIDEDSGTIPRWLSHKFELLPEVTIKVGTRVRQSRVTGDVSGRVVDRGTREPILGAPVEVLWSGQGALTRPDGSFLIPHVSPGLHELRVRTIGYKQLDIVDVEIMRGRTTTVDFGLEEDVLDLSQVIYTCRLPTNRVERKPRIEAKWLTWGDSYATVDSLREALACYDSALAWTYDYPQAWRNRAVALHYLGEPEEALRSIYIAMYYLPGDTVLSRIRDVLQPLSKHQE